MPRLRNTYQTVGMKPGSPRPKRKRSKPKTKRHYAVLISRRLQSYGCPTCGPLGDLSVGIAHAVANQFVVTPD